MYPHTWKYLKNSTCELYNWAVTCVGFRDRGGKENKLYKILEAAVEQKKQSHN